MQFNRRDFLKTTAGASLAAAALKPADAGAAEAPAEQPRRFQKGASPWALVMNASTIRPAHVKEKVRVTAEAGWDSLELWTQDLEQWEKEGGKLKDLGAMLKDKGLFCPNVIGLWNCLPPTQAEFDAQLPDTRNLLRMVSEVGSRYVAVLPFPDHDNPDLRYSADRYKDLIKIAKHDYNLTAAMEFIGFLKGIHSLGQATCVAIDADEREACLIMDTFHLFRGGSGFAGVKHLTASFMADFHWNDVPQMKREEAADKHRIYPGDGVLPLEQAMKDLKAIGYNRTLSLELFNEELWKQDPKKVAEDGLRKMIEQITRAGV